ncbi:ATP-binding protein [Kitasatospora sp. HPMI-4]|uniref:ATP-binding protein n=1 Tax=Kitasatospora sp. HPMI-4 TaxID=3448443 RepID=UPI003F1D3A4D
MTVRPAPPRVPVAASPEVAEWCLSRHFRSVGRARSLLRDQAATWQLPSESAEMAVLLLSELMTNACWHARVPQGRHITARCVRYADRLRVEVSDASSELPEPRQAAPEDESGRGLALVEALADAWGAHLRECGVGKTVWFELGLPAGESGSAYPVVDR